MTLLTSGPELKILYLTLFNTFSLYWIFRNFLENFIFVKNVKRHVCDVKDLRLVHDLPTSVNGRVISPFPEGFISMKLVSQKSTLVKTFLNVQILYLLIHIQLQCKQFDSN